MQAEKKSQKGRSLRLPTVLGFGCRTRHGNTTPHIISILLVWAGRLLRRERSFLELPIFGSESGSGRGGLVSGRERTRKISATTPATTAILSRTTTRNVSRSRPAICLRIEPLFIFFVVFAFNRLGVQSDSLRVQSPPPGRGRGK